MPTVFKRLGDLVTQGHEMVEAARARSRAIDFGFFMGTRPNYATDTLLASYFAMRLFLLLFPLAYVLVAGIGLYSEHSESSSQSATHSLGLTGAIADSVAQAAPGSDRAHILVIAIGVALTVWAGRGALRALRLTHAYVWRLPPPKTPLVGPGGLLFAFGVVLLAWSITLSNRWRNAGVPVLVSSSLIGVVMFGLWLLVSLRMPRPPTRGVDLVPGAVLLGVATPLMNLAVQLYFGPKLARSSRTYGVLGSSLVLLAFLVAVGWATVLATELNAAVFEWRNRGRQQ
jgi:uncharacterized BrkB/YihY/UPF0761 family membrane protein